MKITDKLPTVRKLEVTAFGALQYAIIVYERESSLSLSYTIVDIPKAVRYLSQLMLL
jgi:hypothetical protein